MTGDEERDKEIEKLVEERVESLRQDLQEKNQEIKEVREEVEQLKTQKNSPTANTGSSKNRITRREFLKKAGLGSVGLVALGLSPASALNLRSDSLSFADSNQEYLNIDTETNDVNIDNADLKLNNRSITGVGGLELPRSPASSDHRIWLDTDIKELKVEIGGTVYTSELQSTAIPDSAVARFTLDDADSDGEVCVDSWGTYNGAIESGVTTGATGANQTYETNEAYDFGGTSSAVQLPTLPIQNASQLSIAVWSYYTGGNQMAFGNWDNNNKESVLGYYEGQCWGRLQTSSENIDIRGKSPQNGWHHQVLTFDTGTANLYLDGDYVADDSVSGNAVDLTTLYIGGKNEYKFSDRVDDVRLYNKALTGTEVSNLYQNGSI